MKQDLKVGSAVDDGSGDYLRAGGLKINNNFNELYYQLGDGNNPHAAGAWKQHSTADGALLNAVMGHSYTLNTQGGRINVQLPKGSPEEYNFVIRVRDVYSSWQANPVTLIPATGDTIKGSATQVEIARNFSDLELVYCAPGRWEYVENKQVNRIPNNDLATVATKQFIATEGQTDFLDIFPGLSYNVASLSVSQRGNNLFYGVDDIFDAATAEFGSPGAQPGELVALNGKDIRLKYPCEAGDTVIIKSYNDGLAQWRSSYNRRDITIQSSELTKNVSVPGSSFVGDLNTSHVISAADLNISVNSPINPNACQVMLNSTLLHQAGTAGLPSFYCEGADGRTATECFNAGGQWTQSKSDYIFNLTPEDKIESIEFGRNFEHGDILTVIWYNNDIGTTMEIDEILDYTNNIYISKGPSIDITGQVRITDVDNPFAPNVEPVAASNITIDTAATFFDLVYPIGTIYENTVNPNNPKTYMGFGSWKRLSDVFLVGWSPDASSLFNANNNDLDSAGIPQSTAGGTGGAHVANLKYENIPELNTDDKVLIADNDGPIFVGGCLVDPDSQGPAYTKYREDKASINKAQGTTPIPVNTLPPYLTVHRWMRIA
ncbi:baseplate wedge subunit and tail pin [Escherichia phage KIT01]|nr:baseplate wedge subunit and tail pin [Escherichia phage KIT01]